MDSSQDVLHSWKEIAQYLNRGIRTVQRWEQELGLPIRRPRGKGRSAVIAMRSELDDWLQSCPVEKRKEQIREHLPEKSAQGPRFLLAAAEFGITLADLALSVCPAEKEKLKTTVSKANAAYQTALKFRDRIKLDAAATRRLEARLQELKTALQELEEPV